METSSIRFAEIGLFLAVGLANTAVDFSIYNLLTGRPLRWPRIRANLVSTTVAMGFSFTVNLLWVFPPQHFAVLGRALKFVAVTACSLYLVQSLVIYLATNVWKRPVQLAVSWGRHLPWFRDRSEDVLSRNMVKLLATAFSFVWNFLWYKFYVFK